MKNIVSKKMRFSLLFLFLCVSSTTLVFAQSGYKNKLTAELCDTLATFSRSSNNLIGEYYVNDITPQRSIIVQTDKKQVVNHVGIKLFDREIINEHISPVYYFVERYFLELLLIKDENEIREKLKRERVAISSEIHEMLSIYEGIKSILSSFQKDYSIFLTYKNNRGILSCVKDKKSFFTIAFPLRYELITGDTKLEAERKFYPQLLEYSVNRKPLVESLDLVEYKDSLYKNNENYYITEPMVSTSYYYKDERGTIPVFSQDYVLESTYNLFNAQVNDLVNIEVTQKFYGNKTESFVCSLPLFVEFIRSNGCDLYTAVQSIESTEIKGAVMAVNLEMGYQHLIRYTLSKDLFGNPKNHKVKAEMYSYTPIHNVSTLYQEK